ncbi:hypothetical protein C4K23_4065 [Pseudomonas chlororaphis]|nr:hypothetical protein C4K23_4065 [Pseudomonas chlororaphis]
MTPAPAVSQPVASAIPASPSARPEAAPAISPSNISATTAQPEPAANSNQWRIQQCRKELETMKLYSKASYNKYEAEFQAIASRTDKYMQVKDAMSADINDIVMPGYQFQIREFCFRVKSRLSQLVIRQMR